MVIEKCVTFSYGICSENKFPIGIEVASTGLVFDSKELSYSNQIYPSNLSLISVWKVVRPHESSST